MYELMMVHIYTRHTLYFAACDMLIDVVCRWGYYVEVSILPL